MSIMFIYDPDNNPLIEEIEFSDGTKKIVKYHNADGVDDFKQEALCRTIELYDNKGNLISKTTEKNPYKLKYL